jgi:TM2 domain-containing membrane protein YozV
MVNYRKCTKDGKRGDGMDNSQYREAEQPALSPDETVTSQFAAVSADQLVPAPRAPHGKKTAAARGRPIAKNPAINVLLSFLVPGLGSILAGNVRVGVVILITYIVGWILTFALIGFPILLGAWIWGMVNAHSSAVGWNRRHGYLA